MIYSNATTYKDLLHQIPKLSRPNSVFKDLEKCTPFQGFSRKCGHRTVTFNDSSHRSVRVSPSYSRAVHRNSQTSLVGISQS